MGSKAEMLHRLSEALHRGGYIFSAVSLSAVHVERYEKYAYHSCIFALQRRLAKLNDNEIIWSKALVDTVSCAP